MAATYGKFTVNTYSSKYQVEVTKTPSKGHPFAVKLGPEYASQSVTYAILCKAKDAYKRDSTSDPSTYDYATFLTEVILIKYFCYY